MFLPPAVKNLLHEDEISVLSMHGDLLKSLAEGDVSPSTTNQENFVSEIAGNLENATGKSSKAWLKYIEIKSAFDEIHQLQRMVESKDSELQELQKKLKSVESFSEILQLGLPNKEPISWDQDVLNKLPRDNKEILRKFERALALRDADIVSEEKIQAFMAESGLWKALHNYEKLKHHKNHSATSKDNPRPDVEICASCGGAVIDGRCRCSR